MKKAVYTKDFSGYWKKLKKPVFEILDIYKRRVVNIFVPSTIRVKSFSKNRWPCDQKSRQKQWFWKKKPFAISARVVTFVHTNILNVFLDDDEFLVVIDYSSRSSGIRRFFPTGQGPIQFCLSFTHWCKLNSKRGSTF